jgi:predicted DCC family thiol-disulfide oxidoreductase YuxK
MVSATGHSMIFYDGGCGLCHRAVRFAIARDPDGSRFRFAPLGGKTFPRLVLEGRRAGLPDSLVVLTPDGSLLLRSAAMIHILERIGGPWRLQGRLLALVPQGMRDLGYDAMARVRYRLFGRPVDACPVTLPALRARFED